MGNSVLLSYSGVSVALNRIERVHIILREWFMWGLDTKLQGLKPELHHLFRHPAQVTITSLLFLKSVNSFHLESLHLFFLFKKLFFQPLITLKVSA